MEDTARDALIGFIILRSRTVSLGSYCRASGGTAAGSKGHTALRRFVLESVSQKVLTRRRNRGQSAKPELKKSGACLRGAPGVDTSKLALDECFIHVTPSPVLTDFKRPHNWVLGLVKVLPCVAIRR